MCSAELTGHTESLVAILIERCAFYNFTISCLGGIEDGGVNEAAELSHMEWTSAPRGSHFQPRRTEKFHSATAVLA
jgi:hypothetical protein